MVIYEVNISIPSTKKDEYISWLEPHIEEMLEFEGFENADMYEKNNIVANDDSDEVTQLVVQYHVSSENALDNYINVQAKKMRADGTQKFPEQVITRRSLLRRKTYK